MRTTGGRNQVGGLRHTVRDHYSGLLVKGHDERQWADALAAILDDHDEMIRMGTNAAAHAATFSWDNTAAATLQALFFILIDVAGDAAGGSAGLWPIAGSQLSSLIIGGLLLMMARPGGLPRGAALRWTMVAGPCDMTANALFLLATRGGDLSIVAPLAALYPVTTVILALLIDHERLRGVQVAGLAFAVAALVLVSS